MKKYFGSLFDKVKLTDLLSKDWLVKFISLVLAVGLWYFVGGEDRVDKNVMIPIEIINLPRDLVISNQFKKEIEVTVSGPRSLILDMTSRAITRQVDLSSATPGTMVIENDNEHIPVPRGITVQRVQPSSIILSLDKLIQKQFSISARTVGMVAEGYYLKKLRIDPEIITITGPRTILSQFDGLYTKAINIEGMTQSTQLQVPLELEPAIVELIGETSVTAELIIGLETVARILDEMEVHAVIDGVKRDVQPETVRITASIPQKLLADNLDPKSLLTVTAIQQPGEDQLKVKVISRGDVDLPIEILSIIPDTVSLVKAENDGRDSQVDKPSPAAVPSEVDVIGTMTLDSDKVVVPGADAEVMEDLDDVDASSPKVLKSEKSKRKLNR
jgi:YbbR domain-containing protein